MHFIVSPSVCVCLLVGTVRCLLFSTGMGWVGGPQPSPAPSCVSGCMCSASSWAEHTSSDHAPPHGAPTGLWQHREDPRDPQHPRGLTCSILRGSCWLCSSSCNRSMSRELLWQSRKVLLSCSLPKVSSSSFFRTWRSRRSSSTRNRTTFWNSSRIRSLRSFTFSCGSGMCPDRMAFLHSCHTAVLDSW